MIRRRFMVNIDCATNEVVIDDDDFHYDARLNLT